MPSLAEFLRDFDKYRVLYEKLEGCRELVRTCRLLAIGREVRQGKRSWTLHDLKDIVHWKRLSWTGSIGRIEEKGAAFVQQRLEDALRLQDEESRIVILCEIPGIGTVLASAILTFTSPDTHGVLDRHAWNALSMLGFDVLEKRTPDFANHELLRYLEIIRKLAKEKATSPREVDKALYAFHRANSDWKDEFESILTEWQSAQ